MTLQQDPDNDAQPGRDPIQILAESCDRKGYSPDLTLSILEREGASLPQMLEWAKAYFTRSQGLDSEYPAFEDARISALLLMFGCATNWEGVRAEIEGLGGELIRQLLIRDPGYVQAIRRALPSTAFKRFRKRALARLGMASTLAHALKTRGLPFPNQDEVLAWVHAGKPLVGFKVQLEGFHVPGPSWGHFHVSQLTLRKGLSPEVLTWSSNPICYSRHMHTSELKLEQVSGVRELRVDHFGLSPSDINGRAEGRLSVTECPDLERVDGALLDLHLVGCRNLKHVVLGRGTRSLILDGCPNVRELRGWDPHAWESTPPGEDPQCQVENLAIRCCQGLKRLPPRLRVVREFHLSEAGALDGWPWDLHVGGNLHISDCPGFTVLPPMEVMGSLNISGFSRLRRLQPGTIIRGDLDLHACDQLESLPTGLRVGGRVLLPDHLAEALGASPVPLIDPMELRGASHLALRDHIRSLLLGFRFQVLLPTVERPHAQVAALEALRQVRTYLYVEPYNEPLVIWTAEEVWRDLSEAAWAQARPWIEGPNESDEAFPNAWFLNLVDPSRSNCYDLE